MSKELEALNKAWDLVHEKYPSNNDEIQLVRYAIRRAIELEQALTPPTEQEVCEALGKYLNEPVWFDENNDIRITTQWVAAKWVANKIYLKGGFIGVNFYVVLPPHLITLIGRFYEGKVGE